MHLTENAAVDWLKTFVQSYVYTMKQLVQNTFTELYPETWSTSASAPAMTSQDMVVLATGFSGLFGLLISLGAVYTICRFVWWICLDQPPGDHSECRF